MLTTRPLLALHIETGQAVELGVVRDETRRYVAVRGGRVTGELDGRVLPTGTELHCVRTDGVSEISAHYVVEREDGSRFEIRARGVRVPRPESQPPGAFLAPSTARGYYRMHVRFVAEPADLAHLNSVLAVGMGTRGRDLVMLDVYAVE
jgi:hypothetical protein